MRSNLSRIISKAKEMLICGEQADEELATQKVIEFMEIIMRPTVEKANEHYRRQLERMK